jgi:hypothetical protein
MTVITARTEEEKTREIIGSKVLLNQGDGKQHGQHRSVYAENL